MPIRFRPDALPPSGVLLWAGGAVLLWLAYGAVFVVTAGTAPGAALVDAAANVLPLAVLALMTHALLGLYVLPRPVWTQAALHVVLAVVFATLWYAAVILLLGLVTKLRGGALVLAAFQPAAFTWQVFQGLILYALVAATCYAIRGGRQTMAVAVVDGGQGTAGATPFLSRYLNRSGDAITPVETSAIVSITGAQDYSEVLTISGKAHLVRMSLGEFAARLDPARFLRIHRSTIINFDHLEQVEAGGGGRLVVHMAAGPAIVASRTGSQRLRQFIV